MEQWIAWILLGLSVVGNILQSIVRLRRSGEFEKATDAELSGHWKYVKPENVVAALWRY